MRYLWSCSNTLQLALAKIDISFTPGLSTTHCRRTGQFTSYLAPLTLETTARWAPSITSWRRQNTATLASWRSCLRLVIQGCRCWSMVNSDLYAPSTISLLWTWVTSSNASQTSSWRRRSIECSTLESNDSPLPSSSSPSIWPRSPPTCSNHRKNKLNHPLFLENGLSRNCRLMPSGRALSFPIAAIATGIKKVKYVSKRPKSPTKKRKKIKRIRRRSRRKLVPKRLAK